MFRSKKELTRFFRQLLVILLFFAFFSVPVFAQETVQSQEIRPQAEVITSSDGPEAEGVLFTWYINLTPQQIGNLQFVLDGQPVFDSLNPPSGHIASFAYHPANSTYSLRYYPLLDPGEHTWQIRLYDASGAFLTSNQTEVFEVTEVDPNRGAIATAINNYQDFMHQTMVIGDQTLAEASETSLITFSAISAAIYGVILLVQVSYVLPMGIFAQLLKAFGLFKAGEEPRGFVFNSETYEPVPFAVITVDRVDQSAEEAKFQETIVSGTDGVFHGVNLPIGNYRLTVKKDGFVFPTSKKRATFLTANDYYKGGIFTVTDDQASQQMLIPMDLEQRAQEEQHLSSGQIVRRNQGRNIWRTIAKFITNFLSKLMILFWILAIIVLIATPVSFLNWAIFIIYTLIIGADLIKIVRRPRIRGLVTDENAQPLEGVMVRLNTVETNQLVAVSQTDKKGRYKFFVKKGIYQITAYQEGYAMQTETSFTLTEVDATKRNMINDIMMQSTAGNMSAFFSAPVAIEDSGSSVDMSAPSTIEDHQTSTATTSPKESADNSFADALITSSTSTSANAETPPNSQLNHEDNNYEKEGATPLPDVEIQHQDAPPPSDQIPDFNSLSEAESSDIDNGTPHPLVTPQTVNHTNDEEYSEVGSDSSTAEVKIEAEHSFQDEIPSLDVNSLLKSQFKDEA